MAELSDEWLRSLQAPCPSPWGVRQASALIKQRPDDFRVTELLGLEPTGQGEHLWLWVEKTELTTETAAQVIAQQLACPVRSVSYCGLKDKQAVTRQWFSVHLPQAAGELPVWPESLPLRVLQQAYSQRKLRRGIHQGNAFELTLRQVQGDVAVIEQGLSSLRERGAPNAFGEQRFGHAGLNVADGLRLLAQRQRGRGRRFSTRESIWISAVRSALFNRVLAARIEDGSWDQYCPGDALQLNGRSAVFKPSPEELPDCQQRLAALAIHPTGPLPGSGDAVVSGECAAREAAILAPWQSAITALAAVDIPAQRRALRVALPDLQWQWLADHCLQIRFSLTSGAYATSVLATVFNLTSERNDAYSVEQ